MVVYEQGKTRSPIGRKCLRNLLVLGLLQPMEESQEARKKKLLLEVARLELTACGLGRLCRRLSSSRCKDLS